MSDYIPAYVYSIGISDDEHGEFRGILCVHQKCPKCGRFIKEGDIKINWINDLMWSGWICSKCGEIKPNWWWEE